MNMKNLIKKWLGIDILEALINDRPYLKKRWYKKCLNASNFQIGRKVKVIARDKRWPELYGKIGKVYAYSSKGDGVFVKYRDGETNFWYPEEIKLISNPRET